MTLIMWYALVVEFLQTPAAELFRIIDRQFGYGIEGSHCIDSQVEVLIDESIVKTNNPVRILMSQYLTVILTVLPRMMPYSSKKRSVRK